MLLLALLRDTHLPGQEASGAALEKSWFPKSFPPLPQTCSHSPASRTLSYVLHLLLYANRRRAGKRALLPLHAHDQEGHFLIAAVLTAVALTLVNEAVFVIPTRVDEVFPYGSLEESFTFTTVHRSAFLAKREGHSISCLCVYLGLSLKESLGSSRKN